MKKSTISWHKEDVTRKWHLIDAEGVVLGRLATTVANLLRGKGKVRFTPHVDCGDYVVIINAEKVKLTGKKEEQRSFFRHSGFPGGWTQEPLLKLKEKNPEKIIYNAVRKMIPLNRLGRKVIKKLKIYQGSDYREKAQKPEALVLPKYES